MISFCYKNGMKKLFIILGCLILGACAHKNPLSDMAFQTTPAPPHVIASWYKITTPGTPIKVYVEGDGAAFDADNQPTDNPTPKSEFMRELAAGDPSPNVAYLGRPCQYLQTGACSTADWTTGRFSKTVIDSMDTATHALMKKARTNQVILIGFSGGAQITGQIAARHPDQVKKWITLSGVLDTRAWTTYHGDSPLTGSLNLKKDQVKSVNQIHYAGGQDDVVPPSLIQDFAGTDKVVIVKKAGHGDGFESIYDAIYEAK